MASSPHPANRRRCLISLNTFSTWDRLNCWANPLNRAPAFCCHRQKTALHSAPQCCDRQAVDTASVWIRGIGERGQLLARSPATFPEGERAAQADFDVPVEIRNRLSRLEIENEQSAGAVALLDERWRRRPVGLYSGDTLEASQPLLSSIFYLDRALNPFSDVRRGSVAELLGRELAVMFMADIGLVVGPDGKAIEDWVDNGGVLVRFAGQKMAEKTDTLIPVALRTGGRILGGALTWTQPARLDTFDESSPFHGLSIPQDVLVARQILAEPSLELTSKTWAHLQMARPL